MDAKPPNPEEELWPDEPLDEFVVAANCSRCVLARQLIHSQAECTPLVCEAVRILRPEGYDDAALCRLFGLSPYVIRMIVAAPASGGKARPRRRKKVARAHVWTAEEEAKVCEYWEADFFVKDIAKQLGLTFCSVANKVERMRLAGEIKGRGSGRRKRENPA